MASIIKKMQIPLHNPKKAFSTQLQGMVHPIMTMERGISGGLCMSGKVLKSLIKPDQVETRFIELRKEMADEIADSASPRFDQYITAAKKSASSKPAWQTSALFRTPHKTDKA